jgi:hypothetical protein
MALTTRQTVTLYEILEIPMSSTYAHPTGGDNLLALASSVFPDSMKSQRYITDRLATIAADPNLETELKSQLDLWYSLQGDSTQMDAGGAGGVSGVSFDLKYERQMIRQRVVVMMGISREMLTELFARVSQSMLMVGVIR